MKAQEGPELAEVARADEASSTDEVSSGDEALPEDESRPEEAARLKRLKAGGCVRLVEEARIRPAERAVIR